MGTGASGDGQATVNITMPAPEIARDGRVGHDGHRCHGRPSEIVIAGSGTLTATGIEAESMEVTVAGSGSVRASGTTDRLELTVAGSGSAEMAGLQVDEAEVTIAGSGDAEFASDGRVEAHTMSDRALCAFVDRPTCESELGRFRRADLRSWRDDHRYPKTPEALYRKPYCGQVLCRPMIGMHLPSRTRNDETFDHFGTARSTGIERVRSQDRF